MNSDLTGRALGSSRVLRALELHSKRSARAYPPGTIRLDSGDPDFTPPEAVSSIIESAVRGGSHYGPGYGADELRERIAADLSARLAVHVAPERILVTHGATAGIFAALAATLDPDDRVLLPAPAYSIFAETAGLVGAVPVEIPQARDFHLDLDRLSAAARGARMLVLCNPCNPTGTVYRRDELDAVAALAASRNLLLLVDEVFERIVFDGARHVSSLTLPQIADRLFYVQSFSKTYAMAGWRIGYLVVPGWAIPYVRRAHRAVNGPLAAAAQLGAVAALETPVAWLEQNRIEYQSRRDLVVSALTGVDGVRVTVPAGTFTALASYSGGMPSEQVGRLAVEHGVSVRPGSEFGRQGEGHLSIVFARGGEGLAAGLERLREVLSLVAQGGPVEVGSA